MNGLILRIVCTCGHDRAEHGALGCLIGWGGLRRGCVCRRYRRRLKRERGL